VYSDRTATYEDRSIAEVDLVLETLLAPLLVLFLIGSRRPNFDDPLLFESYYTVSTNYRKPSQQIRTLIRQLPHRGILGEHLLYFSKVY
jgi:hypothetical protein